MRRLYAPGSDSSQTCAHIRTAEDIFHRLPKFSYERMPEIRAGGKKKARENTGGAGNRLFCPLNYGARYFAALIFFSRVSRELRRLRPPAEKQTKGWLKVRWRGLRRSMASPDGCRGNGVRKTFSLPSLNCPMTSSGVAHVTR